MSAERSRINTRRQRQRWRRVVVDILLLPPALLYVIIEKVFWATATALLRAASKAETVNALQRRMRSLPASAVIPMFLIPEVLSHLGGLGATVLLVRHKYLAALFVGVFVKGFATLLTVWIYQSCAPALLSVGWFAWLHRKAFQFRDWVAEHVKPARDFALRLISSSRSGITGRFRAMRSRLATRMGLSRK